MVQKELELADPSVFFCSLLLLLLSYYCKFLLLSTGKQITGDTWLSLVSCTQAEWCHLPTLTGFTMLIGHFTAPHTHQNCLSNLMSGGEGWICEGVITASCHSGCCILARGSRDALCIVYAGTGIVVNISRN